MRHQINDMDLMKLPETMEMAEKIAQNTIHNVYDEAKEEHCVTNEDLDRVYRATKILLMIKDYKK